MVFNGYSDNGLVSLGSKPIGYVSLTYPSTGSTTVNLSPYFNPKVTVLSVTVPTSKLTTKVLYNLLFSYYYNTYGITNFTVGAI